MSGSRTPESEPPPRGLLRPAESRPRLASLVATADSSALIHSRRPQRGPRRAGRRPCSPRGTDARGRRRGSLVPSTFSPAHRTQVLVLPCRPEIRGWDKDDAACPQPPGRRGFQNSRRLFRSAMAGLSFSSSSAPCLNNLNLPTRTAVRLALKRSNAARTAPAAVNPVLVLPLQRFLELHGSTNRSIDRPPARLNLKHALGWRPRSVNARPRP